MNYITFFITHSDIENPEEEKYFYIDILHGGLLRSKNDCPRTRGRRCPIESFNIHNEISPTEVFILLYIILLNFEINSKNISKILDIVKK